MINEIQHTARQHNNNSFRGQGGSRFEPQPKGYGMSQNHHFECPQATFDSGWAYFFVCMHISAYIYTTCVCSIYTHLPTGSLVCMATCCVYMAI